jgi:hypothetical protein
MNKKFLLIRLAYMLVFSITARAADGLIPRFGLEPSEFALERSAQPNTYFDKVGRKFAVLGYESGSFEAWAYPLKLLRNFEFSFLIGSSTQPILGKDIVRQISVTPAATTLVYTFQSFTVKATYVTAIEESGAIIFLAVDTTEPLIIVCSFLPVLQPMWPAGLGGQYASWDEGLKAYLVSEPTHKNHGYIGSPAAQGISYTPAHMLSDSPNQFKIAIDHKDAVKGKFIPVVLAGGKGKRQDVRKIYERLAADPESIYWAAVNHYRRLHQSTLRVKTPDEKINLAFEWAKVAYDNLIVDNPDLGRGLVAGLGTSGTGGRPGFGWFFGGDAFMNSLSLNGYGAFEVVKDALVFSQKWQRDDGKMAHELSQAAGYVDWFKDYPYGYIHGDTTPFYIAACYDYFRMTGDAEFVKKSWPSLKRAYEWCLTTDEDGDGLMDNNKAGLGALEFGSLTGIKTDIFLAAAGVRAAYAMHELAQAVGDLAYAKSAAEQFAEGRKALDEKFWDEEKGRYTYAFKADGSQVKELTPWSAVPLVWGIGETGRSLKTLENLNSAEFTTDWGVRMLSNKSGYFEPLNYNYGAVWPFLSGWAATALFKNNFTIQGYGLLMATVRHTFDNGLGCVTELFSGAQNIWPQEAVAHQGFSSPGIVFPLVRGLLGLEGDAPRKQIVFEPRFPADWKNTTIENYKIGEAVFDLRYARAKNKIELDVLTSKAAGYQMTFAPTLGPGTRILAARLNGQFIRPKMETPGAQAVQPIVEFRLTANNRIEIEFEPTVEILPPSNETKTGELNKGLRIIKMERRNDQIRLAVEGLAGQRYDLSVTQENLIDAVQGAKLAGGQLQIQIPEGAAGEYVRHDIALSLKR